MNASSHGLPDRPRQILTILAILGTFAINVWSNLAPINGMNIGEIANTLFAGVLILPASYAFAIWGLIYLGLFAFGVYQVLPNQQQNSILRRVDYLLIVACVAQAIWVVVFLLRQFWLSTLAMLGILLPLIGIYLQLRATPHQVTRREKWLAQIPFSIYLGWITVATALNFALALYNSNWDGLGIAPSVWAVVVLAISAAIALLAATRYHDVAYSLVIVWALIAIAIRHRDTPLVAGTAIGLAALIGGVILVMGLRKNRLIPRL